EQEQHAGAEQNQCLLLLLGAAASSVVSSHPSQPEIFRELNCGTEVQCDESSIRRDIGSFRRSLNFRIS
ncbi:MAG TPA: hypothetical protein VIG25_14380, partial [Pyrinomonadaceae bacterium]